MEYKFALNFNAVTFTGDPHTTHYPGKGGAIRISKPLVAASSGLLKWDAWSAWPSDDSMAGGGPPVPGQTWDNRFEVWGSNGGPYELLWRAVDEGMDPDLYLTEADAYAAIAALLPIEFSGYESYQVRASFDPMPGDNRNGISLIIEMSTEQSGYDTVLQVPDAPIKEEWQWLTDLQVSYDGTEDRIPLNVYPKRTISGSFSFDRVEDIRRFNATMQKSYGRVFRLPLYQYQVKAKSAIEVGDEFVLCNTLRGDFREEREALIREGDVSELVVIRDVQSDRLVLQTTTVNAYSARAVVVPLTKVFTPTAQGLSRATVNHSGTATFTFREWVPWAPFVPAEDVEAIPTFDSLYVLDRRAVGTAFDSQFDSGIVIQDDYIGRPDISNPWTQGQWAFALRWQCNRLFDLDDWLWWWRFVDAIQGANLNFLIPSFRVDLPITTLAVGGGSAITFTGHEFRDTYYGLDTFSRLVIESGAGRQFVKVTGISNVSGNDRVTFTPALPAGDWSVDQEVGFLMKVRSADDKVICDHYGLHTDVTMSIRTVK